MKLCAGWMRVDLGPQWLTFNHQESMSITKQEYIEYLDEIGVPEDDKRSNGGRMPDCTASYGRWLQRNDPVAFNVGFGEFKRERWINRHVARVAHVAPLRLPY